MLEGLEEKEWGHKVEAEGLMEKYTASDSSISSQGEATLCIHSHRPKSGSNLTSFSASPPIAVNCKLFSTVNTKHISTSHVILKQIFAQIKGFRYMELV